MVFFWMILLLICQLNCAPGPAAPALAVPATVEQDGEAARYAPLGEDVTEGGDASHGGIVVDEARAPDESFGDVFPRYLGPDSIAILSFRILLRIILRISIGLSTRDLRITLRIIPHKAEISSLRRSFQLYGPNSNIRVILRIILRISSIQFQF